LRDTCLGPTASDGCIPSTTLIFTQKTNAVGAPDSLAPSISLSGRFLTFVDNGAGAGLDENGTGFIFTHDTCFGASSACTSATYPTARTGLKRIPLTGDRIAAVPLTADGRYAAYSSIAAADSATPVSGQGDVFLTITPFQ
jgi:hypothetical protein